MDSFIDKIAETIIKSQRILFITGAGISADSGLPTYRGVSGLYESKNTEDGIQIEHALSGGMMKTNPEISWKYISQIEAACRNKQPNQGHHMIYQLETLGKNIWVLTQNIDGFHQSAGSTNVIDIHGHIYDLKCTQCRYKTKVKSYQELATIPPLCPACNRLVRPQVVLFDEMLPLDKLEKLSDELNNGFDMVFSIGTTSVFPYIAQPVLDAANKRIPTIEINPSETTVSHYVTYRIQDTAAKTLDAIWQKIK
jgi:NAD-dependent deacetylase